MTMPCLIRFFYRILAREKELKKLTKTTGEISNDHHSNKEESEWYKNLVQRI